MEQEVHPCPTFLFLYFRVFLSCIRKRLECSKRCHGIHGTVLISLSRFLSRYFSLSLSLSISLSLSLSLSVKRTHTLREQRVRPVSRQAGQAGHGAVQGYLAHKKTPSPRTLQ